MIYDTISKFVDGFEEYDTVELSQDPKDLYSS